MSATPRVAVFVEPTPNPNSLKFILGREIVAHGPYEFASEAEAKPSPLATSLFKIPGVEGVFLGANFVTIRKKPEAKWNEIEPRAIETIEEGAAPGALIMQEEGPGEANGEMSDAEAVIRRILDFEIRPAVASDGGDVVFQNYDNGILTLKLVGSCSGCPSSLMTLKMGIERRLKEDVPGLTEVVSVM
jgi:Fe-S cluster biogenesis protein NfuA